MTPSITISTARPEDETSCRALLREAFRDYVARLGRTEGPIHYPLLGSIIAEQRALVAKSGEELVGVAVYSNRQNCRFIDQLAIRPACQGMGIGGALLNHIEQSAVESGYDCLELSTAEMMTHLVRMYSARGFRIIRTGPPEHGMDTHPRVHMSKQIAAK
jgi:GNAT superfamily N-acetyltransferase